MSTVTSYPIRLEKKIIDAVRPIAKREGRTIKAQIEWLIRIGMVAEPPHDTTTSPLNPHRSRGWTVDKYEKRAMEWCPDELDHAYHSDKHPCKAIAAALRESAERAYMDGVNYSVGQIQKELSNGAKWQEALGTLVFYANNLSVTRSTTRGKGA
jgi:hypothetical protein